MTEEQDIPRLDPLTELGLELRRPIPTGEAFVDWLLDGDGMPEFTETLLRRGFTWSEIAVAVFNLSHGRWAPGVGMLQELAVRQGATA